jgi:hypothetical protein
MRQNCPYPQKYTTAAAVIALAINHDTRQMQLSGQYQALSALPKKDHQYPLN